MKYPGKRLGAIDHVACLDVIVHFENPSQVYKAYTDYWTQPIVWNLKASQYNRVLFQGQNKDTNYCRVGKNQSAAHALSLARIFLKLPSRDREDGRATRQPSRGTAGLVPRRT